ncbi:hypothetical protein [Halobaculum sp. MBLA0143]|uniref:hypothetical protein n=1 Tax=Halobaculum sp. MBLA0143 TaxID=3079933 RepID=UPI003525D046
MTYLLGNPSRSNAFWMILFLLLFGIFISYSLSARRRFTRYTLAATGTVLTAAELRYFDDASVQILAVLVSLYLVSVLSFEVFDGEVSPSEEPLGLPPSSLFEALAIVACVLLFAGVAGSLLSVLLLGESPLLGKLAGSPVAVVYLTGSDAAAYEARVPVQAATVAVMFVAVVADAVRHCEVRWLTAITLAVDIAGMMFFWYYTFWTATVAAVGALLTVIVLALVLDERTEATLD